MNDQFCRSCLGLLNSKETDPGYHAACCQELFGTDNSPLLPYSWSDLNSLAKKTVRNHVTVPGVQPKLSLHLEHETGASGKLTFVGMEGGYILKPPVSQYPEMPELEHVTMRMAKACGIETCPCGLIRMEDGQSSYISRRMDRVDGNKLHMEDMCQLTDRLTERKYSGSMEQVGSAILKHCDNAGFDALRFFDLSIFCFLTGNADMHMKNFSLIYDLESEVRLAAAYDLLPTVLLLPEDKDESALTLNGKKRKLQRSDFESFGNNLSLNTRQVANAFKRLKNGMESALELIDYSFCSDNTKKRYSALISERFRRLDLQMTRD